MDKPDAEKKIKDHTFKFRFTSEHDPRAVVCNESMTVLEALNTNNSFREKNEIPKKEIVIQRSDKVAVNKKFPCYLIEKHEILIITFIKTEEKDSASIKTEEKDSTEKQTNYPSFPSTDIVTFNIKTTGGKGVKHLMKNNELQNKADYVCVYAFKEEEVESALKRDGRFSDKIFQRHSVLSDVKELNQQTKYEMDQHAKHLDKMTFQIEIEKTKKGKQESSIPVEDLDRKVISDNNLPESQDDDALVKTEPNVALDADGAEDVGPSHNPINNEQEKQQDGKTTKSTNRSTQRYAAKPIEEILGILRDQFNSLLETLKQRENLKNNSQIQTFFREEYDKSVQSFLEVKKVKKLMKLSDSVCQIRVEGSARGTGFLLFDRFILTNAHVIGEFEPFSKKLSKTFTAVFGYEDLEANETKCVPIKEQVAAYYFGEVNMGRYLDFALLELEAADEISDCPELLSRYIHAPPPNRGKICIVGHPGEGVKKIDPCFIIERENLQEAADKHISENINLIHVITQQCLAEKWETHDNQIFYDSCFFHGSSGSPVFDEDCFLIGIHTGGFAYKEAKPDQKDQIRSVVEYSYSMQPILESIVTQAKKSGRSDILKLLSEYKSLNLNLEDNDVDMEIDP